MTDNLSMEILSTRLAGAGLCPCTPDPRHPPSWLEYPGWRMKGRGMNTKTRFEVGRRHHVCALRKILFSGMTFRTYRYGMSWVGAKVRLFRDSTKYFSEKFILKPSERVLSFQGGIYPPKG